MKSQFAPVNNSTNDSLGGDSGLENLVPRQPFVKSSNDSLGGDAGLESTAIPDNGKANTTPSDNLAAKK
jgi:hypothetical protein